jgi:outer membrane protein insertion porin family
VATGPQYRIREVTFVTDSTKLSKDIAALKRRTLLRPGKPYNLDLIKGERERIDDRLKNKGYYFFKPDYLLVKVDSTVGDHQVDMHLTLKEETPPEAYHVYIIRDVYVYPNFQLNSPRADTNKANAVISTSGYQVVDRRRSYRPIVFHQAMQFSPGDVYSRKDHNTSLNRLMSLGTFKFVKNRFDPVGDNELDVHYYLTPLPKKSLRFEVGALTQNDSRAGSQASINWRNRNTFRGAELFQVKLSGGFEAQYGGLVRQPNTYHAGAEASISVPRFVVPFVYIRPSSVFMPRTYVKAGYMLETRNRLFRIHSLKSSYGFAWKEEIRKDHQFYPINITQVRTDTLGSTENLNLNYSNLVFNGLIFGPTYQYTFNSQMGRKRRHQFYFDGQADFSGNYTRIGHRAQYGDRADQFLGADLAQYLRFQTDFRYYFNFTRTASWANRLFLGLGMPYANSVQLPNVKQFFSGGNSSLRGFRSRMLGPGTYNEYYLTGNRSYIELLGDVKLEFNTELRTNIYEFLKGALFIDAGNVWLYNDNPNFPGGKFTTNFYREFAADAGLGLRLDFQIIMLRLDLGVPIRKPWLPEGDRWVFNKFTPGDPLWRKENLILNIAIGYPF